MIVNLQIYFFRTNGRTAAEKYSPARRRLPMTPSKIAADSISGISAFVATVTETTALEMSEEDLSGGVPASTAIPSLPQHDPYTPSKRRNPDYVPYYVTNFEYILRCVIDCTDDKDLFNSEEIGTGT